MRLSVLLLAVATTDALLNGLKRLVRRKPPQPQHASVALAPSVALAEKEPQSAFQLGPTPDALHHWEDTYTSHGSPLISVQPS